METRLLLPSRPFRTHCGHRNVRAHFRAFTHSCSFGQLQRSVLKCPSRVHMIARDWPVLCKSGVMSAFEGGFSVGDAGNGPAVTNRSEGLLCGRWILLLAAILRQRSRPVARTRNDQKDALESSSARPFASVLVHWAVPPYALSHPHAALRTPPHPPRKAAGP